MGKEELWIILDRYGMMRPTRDVPRGQLPPLEVRNHVKDNPEGLPLENHDDWRTAALWLHWDLNPYLWTTGGGNEYHFNEEENFY